MAKHEIHEEHENHERWLVSYADFITLLFAFFVVLYAISSVDQKKVRQVEHAVRWALHIAGDGGGGELPLYRDMPDFGAARPAVLPSRTLPALTSDLPVQQVIRRLGKFPAGTPRLLVEVEGRKLTVRLAATGTFLPGSAELVPSAIPTIDSILTELATLGRVIRIEAHTDDTRPRQGRSNWELSALRAAAVVRYAESTGLVPHERLALSGYADTQPIDRGTDEAARQRNRRVDFVVEF